MHFRNTMYGGMLASLVALTTATGLYAIPRGPCDEKPSDMCCDEPKPGPFGFAFPMDMNISCPRDFYVHVDGLLFQAKQDGMEFALEDSGTAGVPSAPITHGKLGAFSNNNSDWGYNPGMRFGLGFYLEHDAWNVDFNWTWLNIAEYKHANASAGQTLMIPLFILGSANAAAQMGGRTSAVWDTDYNTLDAQLGKPYYVSRYLTLNPHFGLRFAWIDQHFSVDYGGTTGVNGITATRTIHHADNDFWGVGSRAGIDTEWKVGKGWCLFGNIAASMLFGKFEVSQSMILPGQTDGFDLDYHFYQNVPNFEIILGFGWGHHFDKNKYHLALKAAYEFHEWWDQLNIRKFFSGTTTYANDVVSRGNFTLNGFSLKVQLDI